MSTGSWSSRDVSQGDCFRRLGEWIAWEMRYEIKRHGVKVTRDDNDDDPSVGVGGREGVKNKCPDKNDQNNRITNSIVTLSVQPVGPTNGAPISPFYSFTLQRRTRMTPGCPSSCGVDSLECECLRFWFVWVDDTVN